MTGDVTTYTDLVTSQHADKAKFMAMVGATCQPFADVLALYDVMLGIYDLDTATGQQLDTIGLWIGIGRELEIPLTGAFFALDTSGLGFDQGVWNGVPGATEVILLPDDHYRLLLKVKAVNNQWDGSIPAAYAAISGVFSNFGYTFIIVDNGDLTMQLGLIGSVPITALALALLESGKFDIKPAGVRVSAYLTSSTGPVFAFDEAASIAFAGFDIGGWA